MNNIVCGDLLRPDASLCGKSYEIPGVIGRDRYIIPVSGGADSSALCVLMHEKYPHVPFELWFSDTLAEEPEIYETLDKLEDFVDKKIERMAPEEGLYELIERWGGYLPSAQSRWCTATLKLKPFNQWLKSVKRHADQQIWIFIGIRADEPTRVAFTSSEVNTEMPFIDLGIRRENVFEILERSIGIPRFYLGRTRSGCSACPFSRRSESLSLLQRHPSEFDRASRYEKLSEEDSGRFARNPEPLHTEVGMSLNHMTLPIPPAVDARGSSPGLKWGRVKWGECASLFEEELPMATLWVGAVFMVNPWVGDHGVWRQEIVTFSSSKGGVSRQLNGHYEHRLQTAEVLGVTQDDVRNEARYAIYRIEVPSDKMDAAPLRGKSFTWRKGDSMLQLKHLYQWATRSLHAAGLEQEAEGYKDAHPLSWQTERREGLLESIAMIRGEIGRVVSMDRFIPKEPGKNEEIDELAIPCPMCSI